MASPLGPKYIPYTYMDPLGARLRVLSETRAASPQQDSSQGHRPACAKSTSAPGSSGLLLRNLNEVTIMSIYSK